MQKGLKISTTFQTGMTEKGHYPYGTGPLETSYLIELETYLELRISHLITKTWCTACRTKEPSNERIYIKMQTDACTVSRKSRHGLQLISHSTSANICKVASYKDSMRTNANFYSQGMFNLILEPKTGHTILLCRVESHSDSPVNTYIQEKKTKRKTKKQCRTRHNTAY